MVTKPISFYETPEWIKGDDGQKLIARLLQDSGWYVLPSYDYNGEDDKAPRLQGAKIGFVIPDLDIAKEGDRRWAEVKTKESASWTHVTQQFEHGIPLRHYRDYLRVQEITGCEVWLFIYEKVTGDVLYAKLDDLAKVKRTYTGNKMNWGGMVFFPRDAFKLWMNIKERVKAA